jgi:hypothetical protein
MRFLKLFLKYLITSVMVLPVVGFIVINVLVYIQALTLSDAISSVKKLSVRPAHVRDCITTGDYEIVPLYGYQLRFLDDKEYVVEAVCATEKGPFEVSTGILDFGVKKLPGYSGVMFPLRIDGQVEGRVVIGLLFSKWSIEVGDKANMIIRYVTDEDKIVAGINAAKSTCSGWGYRCCNYLMEVGEGEAYSQNILDCAGDCYDSCLARPSILIFTTDPKLTDQKNRILDITKKEPGVVFSYSVQDVDSVNVKVTIDYGDGESAVSNNQTDQFSHYYNCQKTICTYEASLQAVDNEAGLENTRSRISTITVRVK